MFFIFLLIILLSYFIVFIIKAPKLLPCKLSHLEIMIFQISDILLKECLYLLCFYSVLDIIIILCLLVLLYDICQFFQLLGSHLELSYVELLHLVKDLKDKTWLFFIVFFLSAEQLLLKLMGDDFFFFEVLGLDL